MGFALSSYGRKALSRTNYESRFTYCFLSIRFLIISFHFLEVSVLFNEVILSIFKGIISHFSEQNGTYTVIHKLATSKGLERKCGSFGTHSRCR